MAHSSNVHTVVETPSYLAPARKLFSESEMSEIVAMVAADPKCGDLRETGGFRKVRVRVGNRGKSGGAWGMAISATRYRSAVWSPTEMRSVRQVWVSKSLAATRLFA